MPDDSYLTKQVEKELKSMNGNRLKKENEAKIENILLNFAIKINETLQKGDIDDIDIIVNSYALYVNTLLDLANISKKKRKSN